MFHITEGNERLRNGMTTKEEWRRNSQTYRERHPNRAKRSVQSMNKKYHRQALNALMEFYRLPEPMCMDCGSTERLQVNHVEGGGYRHRRETSWYHIIKTIKNKEADLNNYSILCKVCNWLDGIKRQYPEIGKHYTVLWGVAD